MSTVKIEQRDNVAVLKFDSGVTHPVGSDLVNDLSSALGEIADSAGGMVLTGGEKFFSIGLNLPELVALDRSGMSDFWRRFIGVTQELYSLPMVTVAAIGGHAPAAGTVFALACDFRVSAEGKKMLGLNEIKLGIPVPYITDQILRQVAGDRVATDMLYSGKFIMPAEALQVGVVDEVHPQEAVLERAIEKAASIASYERAAFAAIKATRTEEICAKYQQNAARVNEAFLDCWFSDTTQKLLAEAVEKF